MAIKVIGAVVLLLCGGLWCALRAREELGEQARVAGFAALFARVGERIEGLCLPLDDILASLPPALLQACGMAEGTYAALCAAMATVRDDQAAEMLARACAQLGRGTREDQVRLCAALSGELQRRSETMREDCRKNGRARAALVMCGALGGIILLW